MPRNKRGQPPADEDSAVETEEQAKAPIAPKPRRKPAQRPKKKSKKADAPLPKTLQDESFEKTEDDEEEDGMLRSKSGLPKPSQIRNDAMLWPIPRQDLINFADKIINMRRTDTLLALPVDISAQNETIIQQNKQILEKVGVASSSAVAQPPQHPPPPGVEPHLEEVRGNSPFDATYAFSQPEPPGYGGHFGYGGMSYPPQTPATPNDGVYAPFGPPYGATPSTQPWKLPERVC